jgi:hypothetical protein
MGYSSTDFTRPFGEVSHTTGVCVQRTVHCGEKRASYNVSGLLEKNTLMEKDFLYGAEGHRLSVKSQTINIVSFVSHKGLLKVLSSACTTESSNKE